jgi:hypothetical protein
MRVTHARQHAGDIGDFSTIARAERRNSCERYPQAAPEGDFHGEKESKEQTHDCRCGQIKRRPRTKDCNKGSNCRGECRRHSRRRNGHEVNARSDAGNRKAVWKKQNKDGQDWAKEKALKH